ncbi:hypothetical protein LCI18_014403 [Fusarium solani-melongenae]|uniref:Uncharacterized protein n=1 Tax=Fusarium solani subsp. cucurbitae TaxID=2747967 RepID=A0ACD3ZQW2_FUSSC|nr:hypothetical protein LCI18_014403 [Fusarium solani-melongenae]
MAFCARPSGTCLRCAEIKQGCKGGIPCDRCTRLSLPCRPKNPVASQPRVHILDDFDNILLGKPKAKIRRVQTGCLTCKARKKKCDERKPHCGDCRRLCLQCSWPAERPGRRRVGDRDNEIWSDADQILGLSTERSRSLSHSTDSAESNLESSLDASIADLLCQMSSASAFDAPVIDEASPTQEPCWSLSPDVAWLDILPKTPSVNASPPVSIKDTSLSLYTPSLVPDMTSPHDKALLNHYSTIVASVLSRRTNTASNPYVGYILPMAMSNQLILHSVLALSATHWQRLQPCMRDRALFHQGQATQSLARLLPHVDVNSVDIALASCLLLCMTELFDGTSQGWKLHLQGAKRLLSTLKFQHGDKLTGHFKFSVKLARFLDSAATTSTCKPPLIDNETVTTSLELTEDVNGEDTAVYGIPKELFHLVDRINNLASKRGTRVDDRSEALFRHEARKIQGQLDNWAYDYGGLAGAVASLSSGNDDVLHATIAYEWALRLRLHQITEGYSLGDKVSECVERIIESAQKVRYGSSLESCLLFPLVMAGGSCDCVGQRLIVQDRLMVMERTCGFGYIHQSRELVEKVWKRRETEPIVNWARIRYEEMGGLALY